MSQAYHPFRNRRPSRERGARDTSPQQTAYFEQALACLAAHPERISILVKNLHYYQQQQHLPKSAKAAIQRFEYLLAVTQDPHEIAQHVLEDSYEGRKFRQLPLLLKGLCDPAE